MVENILVREVDRWAINIRYLFLSDQVSQQNLELNNFGTSKTVRNFMTKALQVLGIIFWGWDNFWHIYVEVVSGTDISGNIISDMNFLKWFAM